MTEAELVTAWAPEVQRQARGLGWYLPGADFEDLLQEGLIGLLLAVRNFDPENGMPFHRFARMCIRRQLITALKTANRHKHQPLTEANRRAVVDDAEVGCREVGAAETIPDPRADVYRRVAGREALRSILRAAEGMTDIERRAIFGVAYGAAYVEIDGPGGVKRADNAQTRALEKLRAAA